jgi:hypothetical protein
MTFTKSLELNIVAESSTHIATVSSPSETRSADIWYDHRNGELVSVRWIGRIGGEPKFRGGTWIEESDSEGERRDKMRQNTADALAWCLR